MRSAGATASLLAAALVAGVTGVGLLRPALQRLVQAPPTPGDVLRLAGPVRVIPVPFVWLAWARAHERGDIAYAVSVARWITRLLPEREDIFVLLAWELAYDAAAAAPEVRSRARFLGDAVQLLEEAIRLHPQSDGLCATAALILLDKTTSGENAQALRTAFRQEFGEDPVGLGRRYQARALELAPDVRAHGWVLGRFLQEQAADHFDAGAWRLGARLLARAADHYARDEPQRAHLLERAAAELAGGPEGASSELLEELEQDDVLGRAFAERR